MKPNLVLPAALGLLVVILVAIALAGGASAEPTFRAVRLSPNAPDSVAKAALSYTRAYMRVLSGVPEVVYVGPVNSAGLPGVGLQEMDSPNPLVLAIVKADVDIAGAFPRSVIDADSRYNYVCYVFDCETGLPMQIYAELRGGCPWTSRGWSGRLRRMGSASWSLTATSSPRRSAPSP